VNYFIAQGISPMIKLYPDWFKGVSTVNMPYSDCCYLDTHTGVGAETGISGHQYNYLCDNFKVIVVNFKSCREK
jgi:hypothetical protein